MYAKKNSGKKTLAMLLAVVLLIGVSVGGTLAWLQDSTTAVTNTFTVGNIDIDLKEHSLVDGELSGTEVDANIEDTYKILPGTKQPKDPFVRVEAGSEACYVFVQVQEVNNAVGDGKYVDWSEASGWNQLGTTENNISTYWKEQDALTAEGAQDAILYVLAGDTDYENGVVTYADTLTKANIDALDKNNNGTIEDDEMPKLIFKAFAVQKEAGTDASAAWTKIPEADRLPD